MDLDAFRASLAEAEPPALSAALEALWWDAKGDWHKAHEVAQRDKGRDGAWVHAYLHRVEGDLSNARYWYRRAEQAECLEPTAAEWDAIAAALLKKPGALD